MPCDHSKRGRIVTVGDRDTSVGWYCDGGGDTRYDFKRDACLHQNLGLFTSASKDKWVAPFKAYHRLTTLGVTDHGCIDLFLGHGMMTRTFANIDEQSVRASLFKKFRANQAIIEHNIRTTQAA
jgi:hypothetical protein